MQEIPMPQDLWSHKKIRQAVISYHPVPLVTEHPMTWQGYRDKVGDHVQTLFDEWLMTPHSWQI
jgi:hypothetical protein